MRPPVVLVTGFEPFLDVARNPSGLLAQRLEHEPPAGVSVLGRVLPVSFSATPPVLAGALAEARGAGARALLGLGVHRGAWFRLERGARARLDSPKADDQGLYAAELGPLGERDLATTLDLDALAEVLRAAGATDVRTSDDAGGFLCERAYYDLLAAGEALGVPALFLHVPPLDALELDAQARVVRALVAELARLGG
ncbi:MAG: hypothetical protein H6828_09020 [Planctomycetes bacterium]|nr:hypothetical protein [Planctomycetota bacterium]